MIFIREGLQFKLYLKESVKIYTVIAFTIYFKRGNHGVCVLAGSLSEEGLLLYLRALQTLLPLLPVSESSSRPEVSSDSEDEDDTKIHPPTKQVQWTQRAILSKHFK